MGQLGSSTSTQGSNSQTATYSYAWYDGAVKTQASVTGTGAQSAGVTDYILDAFGLVRSSVTTGGYSGSQSYIYDAADQGVVRSETYNAQSWSDNWYRMGGVNIWHYSNRFGYNAQAGDTNGSGGRYTVRSGDTLAGIAQQLWGDASLWYKIAEANGLSASSSLTDGQSLTIPAGVFRNSQTAQTFLPYDQGKFLQLAEPSALFPAPVAARKGCGAFGMILLAVIAIAVATVVTAGIGSLATGASFSSSLGAMFSAGGLATLVGPAAGATALGGTAAVAAGVAGAVAGSIVSQGVGVATGIQDKFSWKGVALAGIGAGIGGALGGLNAFGPAASGSVGGIANAVVRGALTSGLTQGIGVVTGLQKKFDWAGVAAAGVGAGVSDAVAGNIGGAAHYDAATGKVVNATFGNFAASSASGAIANAATRSAINGESFGQNLIAAIPDVLANILQRAIGTAMDGVTTPAKVGAVTTTPVADTGKKVTTGGDKTQVVETESDEQADEIIVTATRINRTTSDFALMGYGKPNSAIAEGKDLLGMQSALYRPDSDGFEIALASSSDVLLKPGQWHELNYPNTFEFPALPSTAELDRMLPTERAALVNKLLRNISVYSMLDTISYAEGADYNSLVGDGYATGDWKFDDYSKHPGQH